LSKKHGLDLKAMSLPLVVVYLAASVGSIGGGWISSALIARGISVNYGRKIAMLICALCVVPMFFAGMASEMWIAVGLISLAVAAHQGWSANLFTTVSDMFPKSAVGSVVGIGGMAGAVGGMFIAKVVGYVLDATGSYVPVFIIAGSAYLIALVLFHWITPKMQQVNIE
jgi:ACS family hexuronate transporter-like MFS transporter